MYVVKKIRTNKVSLCRSIHAVQTDSIKVQLYTDIKSRVVPVAVASTV